MESKKFDISEGRRVRIKPNAKVFVGDIGVATMVTDNLSYLVTLSREYGSASIWFEHEELEFF
jgi:hypothetical protein